MRKSIVSVLLLLGAGVALGAVSQRVLVTRVASEQDCAGVRCASTASALTPATSIGSGTSPPVSADPGTVNAQLASKPMPAPLPQAEPGPSAWITPYNFDEAVDIVPMSENVVVKSLALPAGQYTVQGTLDLTSYVGGLCGLKVQYGLPPDDIDTAHVGASQEPFGYPPNEILTRQRISLQGAVAFGGSGGVVLLVCRADSGSAYSLVQMYAERPVLSAQLQRAVVLAPP